MFQVFIMSKFTFKLCSLNFFFLYRLAYFERTNALLTTHQLLEEAKGHYISQGVKQAYVFILGLEVLGNPYGLFRDVKEGISDFFYEPYLVSKTD